MTWRFHVTVITAEHWIPPGRLESTRRPGLALDLIAGEVGDSLRVLADLDHQDRPLTRCGDDASSGMLGMLVYVWFLFFLTACGL
jgi:hypothetical protein